MRHTIKQVFLPILLIRLILSPLTLSAAITDFPVPDNIRLAISFWIKVYTEADTQSGFLHDAQELRIIYRKLDRDRDTINSVREKIRDDLRVLASGKRSGLTPSQQELLELWGSDTANARLEEAANNVRWQLGQSDRFIEGIRRSGAYRSHIDAVIREKKLPQELAILPHVESSFHPGAYSRVAATGMWQFTRSTAQRFMRADYVVDERLDPYAATYAAMELLEYNHNALGSWPLALTAYNHGANGMARALRDVGSADIGRIIAEYKGPRFGFASRNFYPQFLAALEVDTNAIKYFGDITRNPAPEFTSFTMSSFVDARVVAKTLGVSLNDLERDNPALQPAVWSGTKRIPRGYVLKIDRLSFSGDLVTGINTIPLSELFSEQIPDLSYVVRSGDTLSVIAERYKTSVSELVAINQLRDRNTIRIGQTLLLPQQDGTVPTLLVNNSEPMAVPADGEYEVRRGDTVSLIAERHRVPLETVLALNNLDSTGIIFPGQTLRLKGDTQFAPASVVNEVVADADTVPEDDDIAIDADSAASEQVAILVNSVATAVEPDAGEVEAQLLADLQSDPTDYSVRIDNTIEIQAAETLGHYAEWLGLRSWDIRRLNGLEYRDPVIIGKRLKLDFSKVGSAQFEQMRREFHRNLQSDYFQSWRIRETEQHSISRGEFLVNLARERSVPMWLFRQYNPDVDAGRIQIGQVVVFPVVEKVDI
jgi:membrane-bound lytic murein transglycosylase D